jgi:hypothetical protein
MKNVALSDNIKYIKSRHFRKYKHLNMQGVLYYL